MKVPKENLINFIEINKIYNKIKKRKHQSLIYN